MSKGYTKITFLKLISEYVLIIQVTTIAVGIKKYYRDPFTTVYIFSCCYRLYMHIIFSTDLL